MESNYIERLIQHLQSVHEYPPYFTPDEFMCKCEYPDCEKTGIDMHFVWRLSLARVFAGIPFNISSGWRCVRHNADEGGETDSSHPRGWAVDITEVSPVNKMRIYTALYAVGFGRIGIYSWGIHVDMDPSKISPCLWRGKT